MRNKVNWNNFCFLLAVGASIETYVSKGKQTKTHKHMGQRSNYKLVSTYLFETKVGTPKLKFKRQSEDNWMERLSWTVSRSQGPWWREAEATAWGGGGHRNDCQWDCMLRSPKVEHSISAYFYRWECISMKHTDSILIRFTEHLCLFILGLRVG